MTCTIATIDVARGKTLKATMDYKIYATFPQPLILYFVMWIPRFNGYSVDNNNLFTYSPGTFESILQINISPSETTGLHAVKAFIYLDSWKFDQRFSSAQYSTFAGASYCNSISEIVGFKLIADDNGQIIWESPNSGRGTPYPQFINNCVTIPTGLTDLTRLCHLEVWVPWSSDVCNGQVNVT